MKSVSQIAKQYGVTRQYVYQLVKQNGIDLQTCQKEKQGNTTLYGDETIKAIENLLCKKPVKQQTELADKVVIKSMRAEIDNLHAKVAALEATVAALAADKAQLFTALEAAQNNLAREQHLHAADISQRRTGGLIGRVRALFAPRNSTQES